MGELADLLRFFLPKKFPFKIIYSSDYWMVDIGKNSFAARKYRLLYEKLLRLGVNKGNFLKPLPAGDEDILLVHSPKYLKKLKSGGLSSSEAAAIELPFSPELVKFAVLSVGGTVIAAREAMKEGMAVHIGGGFHHAFPDHGEGFCVLNDVAVAVEKLKKERKIGRAMVMDCDLHQGNGTAEIFAKKDYAFTFSIHQEDIYPSEKPPSTMDIGLWSGDGDEKYLAALKARIPAIYKEFRPDILFYLAGADPFEKDQLGGLLLTKEGLKERDRIVIEGARRLKIPVVIVLAGGYAADVEDTVAIHLNTIKVAQKAQKRFFQAARYFREAH